MLTEVWVLAGAMDGALGEAPGGLLENEWHCLWRMVYPIDLRQTYLDLRQEAHALPYNGFTHNRLNSETEIYDTTMSMLNGCPL